MGKIPQSILNLDLCCLAYQIYHQSLIWPLDPWYDTLYLSGGERRVNTMARVHQWAEQSLKKNPRYKSGPNAARGWDSSNKTLEPVITDYLQINPALPAFTRDGSSYKALRAPAYVTDPIQKVLFTRYKSRPGSFPALSAACETVTVTVRSGQGRDVLVAFEGGTGNVAGSQPAWSCMGFVLARHLPGGGHDVHVVFRGSRSGADLLSSFMKGLLIGQGNPDWVTDMGNAKQGQDTAISDVGTVGPGFGAALKTMIGPIKAALLRLHDAAGIPRQIHVSGHSLGGALATLFTSAITQGAVGDNFRDDGALKEWPWEDVHCHAFAEPALGNQAWAMALAAVSHVTNIWVDGDIVVYSGSHGANVSGGPKTSGGGTLKAVFRKGVATGGGKLSSQGGANAMLPKPESCKDDAHQLYVIRAALVDRIMTSVGGLPKEVRAATTWAAYPTFVDMLAGKATTYLAEGAAPPDIVTEDNIKDVLKNGRFCAHFAVFLRDIYAEVVAMKGTYQLQGLLAPSKGALKKRRDAVAQAADRLDQFKPRFSKKDELDDLLDVIKGVSGKLGSTSAEHFVCLGIILGCYERTRLTLQDLRKDSFLRECLESKLVLEGTEQRQKFLKGLKKGLSEGISTLDKQFTSIDESVDELLDDMDNF